MALTSWNSLSIVVLTIYTPALLIGIFLWVRHGRHRDSWLYLTAFAIIRLVGASLQLATIGATISSAIGFQTAVARLFYIRLSPLLLATLSLLNRVHHSINKTHRTRITPLHLRLVSVIVVVALVLVIVGVSISATDLAEVGVYTIQITTEVGVALFVVVYATMVLIAGIFGRYHSHVEVGERHVLIAVIASIPFVLVRLIYTILATFTSTKKFGIIDGSVVIMACASDMEEIAVVVIYEAIGFMLGRIPEKMGAKKRAKWWRGPSRAPTEIHPLGDEMGAVPSKTGNQSGRDGSSNRQALN